MKAFSIISNCTEEYFLINFNGFNSLLPNEDYCYKSSYQVLNARLLGLSYPSYLRFCQSKGAKLHGRDGYAYPTWKNKKECQEVCNMIEKEWQKLIKEINFKSL